MAKQLDVFINIKDNFSKANKELNRQLKQNQNELKLCDERLKNNSDNTELLAHKQQLLAQQTELYNRKAKETTNVIKVSNVELQKKKSIMDGLEKEIQSLTQQYTKYSKELGEEDKLTKKTLTDLNKKQNELKRQSKQYDQIANSVQKYNTSLTKVQIEQVKTSRAFAETSIGADKLGTSLENITKQDFTKLADGALKFGMSLGTVVTSLSALGANADMTFEYGNAKIATISPDGVDINRMGKEIRELSDETGVAIGQIQEAYYQALSSGIEFSGVNTLVTKSITASKAAFAELGGTIDVATSIMNAWKLNAKDVDGVMNALFKTTELGKVTMSELSSDLGRVIASASQSGLEIEQILSAVAQASLQGMSSNLGITYLNSMLNELSKSGTKVSNIIKDKLGMSFQDAIKSGKELSEIIDVIEGSGTSLTDAFGSQEASRMAAVLADGKSYLDLLNQIENSSGVVDKAFEKVNETQYAEFEQTINRLKNSMIDLGISAQPLIDMFIDGVELVSEGLQKVDTNTVKILAAISALSIGLGGLFKIGNKVNTILSVLGSKNITSLGMGLKGLLTGALNPLTLKLMAIPLAVGAVCVAFDKLNVTAEEQAQKVSNLTSKYDELKNEVDELESKSNKTNIETSMLKYKQLELEATDKLLEKNNKLLAQKELFGKGVAFDAGLVKETNNVLNEVQYTHDRIKELEDYASTVSDNVTKTAIASKINDKFDTLLESVPTLTSHLQKYRESLQYLDKEEKQQVENTIKQIEQQLELINAINETNKVANDPKEVPSLSKEYEDTVEKIEVLNKAINSLSEGDSLTSDTVSDLLSVFPDLRGEITETNGVYSVSKDILLELKNQMESTFVDTAKAIENASKQFDNASDKIATLNAISKELKESNGLSADSFKKIASEFPELLGYMNDEASLADAIKDKMESLSAVQGDAYRQMLFNSEEYYEQNVLGNEQMINSISSGIENLFRNLSIAYDGDLNNWKTLAQGKADIETQLIASLNKAWESHFGTLMTQFNKMANTPIANPQFDEAKYKDRLYKENPFLTSTQTDILLKAARDTFNKQTSDYKQFQAEVVKRNQELSNMFSDVKFDAIDIKIGGKSTKPKKSKDKSNNELINKLKKQFEADKAAILKYGEDIEKEIERVNQKIEMAELKGDTKLVESLNIELETLYSTRPNATKKMADELRALKDKAIQQVSSAGLKSDEKLEIITELTADFDEDIAEQSTNWWKYSNELIEHQIKLLELKKEIASKPLDNMQLEISSHENKIKLLELENGTMTEQVTAYNQLLDSEEKRENYLRLTIDDFTKQRDLLDSTSQQYKTLTEYILDFENQLTDSLQAQANAREKLIDMMYDEMELALEKSIYGDDGKDAWEKANTKRIESLNEELDLLKKQSDEKKKQQEAEERLLEIKKLEEQLENAKKQKTVKEFQRQEDGSHQWVYVADAEKVAQAESNLAQKVKEHETKLEDEKQAKKEQSLRDEISRLQKEQRAKEQFYNESKEDLLQYLNDNKESLVINGEEVLGIVTTNMDNINAEFDTKMELITNSLQEKLAQIKAMFQDALSMSNSMGSMGGGGSSGGGKPVYSNKGGSGKTYFQYGDGSVEVLRPDGTSSTVKPGDKNYSSTISAMEKDHVKKRYKKGGIVNDTGLMYLDGTDLEPEWVLNAEQTKAFVGSMDSMPEFNENMKAIKELANIAEMRYDFSYARDLSKMQSDIGLNRNRSIGDSITNNNATQIHIDKIELPNVKEGREFVKELDSYMNNLFSGLPQKAKLIPSGEW